MNETSIDKSFNKAVIDRLSRMEARIVEGFNQLGVNVKEKPDERIMLDMEQYVVYIPHQGISLGDVLNYLKHHGVPDATELSVYCNGVYLCSLIKE